MDTKEREIMEAHLEEFEENEWQIYSFQETAYRNTMKQVAGEYRRLIRENERLKAGIKEIKYNSALDEYEKSNYKKPSFVSRLDSIYLIATKALEEK